MSHGLLVGKILFSHKLVGALVQLRGHLRAFVRGTAHRHQHLSQLRVIDQDAGAILMLSTPMRLVGLLCSPPPPRVVGVSPILPSTSSPLMTSPKAVYCLSRKRASARQMKNWLPAESGCCERAMERTPRTWGRSLNSALIL